MPLTLLAACDPPSLETTAIASGLLRAEAPAYHDRGPADDAASLRALIALPTRDPDVLDATIDAIYDPASPTFRSYLTLDDWSSRHAPEQAAVDEVVAWLVAEGFEVPRISKNRLLVSVTGSVATFNRTFATELHDYTKLGDARFHTFGHHVELRAPIEIAPRLAAVVVADPPADASPLPGETGTIVNEPPNDDHLTLATVARTYGADALAKSGATGQGITIGIVVGAAFKFKDVQSFWQSQGIVRADPTLIETMEPLATRFSETTLDIEWAGGIAPGADLVVYAGPDAHDTSLVYTFNEAVGDGRAHVITDSFAHREDATPREIALQYHASARMAAALGITVVAASGDSAKPDVPSSSPYVTAVGGTVLVLDAQGARSEERAWSGSGSGDSADFAAPSWQRGISGQRATADVALASGTRYWFYVFGAWRAAAGTSFAAPVFAGLVAVISSARVTAGKPVVGFLNPALYTTPAVQATFYDVVTSGTSEHAAGIGWDYPTGFGAPDAARLLAALP